MADSKSQIPHHPVLLNIMQEVFAYGAFRGAQEAIFQHVRAGGDAWRLKLSISGVGSAEVWAAELLDMRIFQGSHGEGTHRTLRHRCAASKAARQAERALAAATKENPRDTVARAPWVRT